MNIRILDEAEQDLIDGFWFYEMQEEGLGDYFLDTLFSDIDSLCLYAGTHPLHFGYYRLLSKRFPYFYFVTLGCALVGQTRRYEIEPRMIGNVGPDGHGATICGCFGGVFSGFERADLCTLGLSNQGTLVFR